VSILDVGLKEVDIEVLENPGRSLFGLRKNEAEVRVTLRVEEDLSESIEQLIDGVLDSSEQVQAAVERPVVDTAQNKTGARILNNNIVLLFTKKGYPVIEPKSNVRLFVNNVRVEKRVIVQPRDKVTVKVSDELIPPFFR